MKTSIIKINPDFKKIDDSYFNNYGGGNYSDTYIDYTYHPISIISQLEDHGILFNTLLDAGCASGQLILDLRKRGIQAYGIDNNKSILEKSVCPSYTMYGDIRNLEDFPDNSFDVVYLNSLMYLLPQEVLPTLKGIHRICNMAVFLCNPFLGDTENTSDPYRKFLAKPSWWEKQFKEASFNKISKNIYKV